MVDEDAILVANEAFYRAFAMGDVPAMEAIWSTLAPVACIHPGWDALTDRQSVMQSWRGILESPPPVSCANPQAFIFADAAFVICEELILGGVLIATNMFVREGQGWKIVHHHAGQVDAMPAADLDEDEDEDDEDDENGPSRAVH